MNSDVNPESPATLITNIQAADDGGLIKKLNRLMSTRADEIRDRDRLQSLPQELEDFVRVKFAGTSKADVVRMLMSMTTFSNETPRFIIRIMNAAETTVHEKSAVSITPIFTDAFVQRRVMLGTIAADPRFRLPQIKNDWQRWADKVVNAEGFGQIVRVFGRTAVREALGEKEFDRGYEEPASDSVRLLILQQVLSDENEPLINEISQLRKVALRCTPITSRSRTNTVKVHINPEGAADALQKAATLCAKLGLRTMDAPDTLLAVATGWARADDFIRAVKQADRTYDFGALLRRAYDMDDLLQADKALKDEEHARTEQARVEEETRLSQLTKEQREKATAIREAEERGKYAERKRREQVKAEKAQQVRKRQQLEQEERERQQLEQEERWDKEAGRTDGPAKTLILLASQRPELQRHLTTLGSAFPSSEAAGLAIVGLLSATSGMTIAAIAMAVGLRSDVISEWQTAALESIARECLRNEDPHERWYYESVAAAFSNYGVGRDILEEFLTDVQSRIRASLSGRLSSLKVKDDTVRAVVQHVLGCNMAMADDLAPGVASPHRSDIDLAMRRLNTRALKTLYKAHEAKGFGLAPAVTMLGAASEQATKLKVDRQALLWFLAGMSEYNIDAFFSKVNPGRRTVLACAFAAANRMGTSFGSDMVQKILGLLFLGNSDAPHPEQILAALSVSAPKTDLSEWLHDSDRSKEYDVVEHALSTDEAVTQFNSVYGALQQGVRSEKAIDLADEFCTAFRVPITDLLDVAGCGKATPELIQDWMSAVMVLRARRELETLKVDSPSEEWLFAQAVELYKGIDGFTWATGLLRIFREYGSKFDDASGAAVAGACGIAINSLRADADPEVDNAQAVILKGLAQNVDGALDDLHRFSRDVNQPDEAAWSALNSRHLQRIRHIAARLNAPHRDQNITPFHLLGLVFPALGPAELKQYVTDLEISEATPRAEEILGRFGFIDALTTRAKNAIVDQREVGLAAALSAYVLARAQSFEGGMELSKPLKKALLEHLTDKPIIWNSEASPRSASSNVLKAALRDEGNAERFNRLALQYAWGLHPRAIMKGAVRDMIDLVGSVARASAGDVLEALNNGPCRPEIVDSWEANVALEQLLTNSSQVDPDAGRLLETAVQNPELCAYLGRVRGAISGGRALTPEDIETTLNLALANKNSGEPAFALDSIIRASKNVYCTPERERSLRRAVVRKAIEATIPAFPTERWLIERGFRNYPESHHQGAEQLHALLELQHSQLSIQILGKHRVSPDDVTLEAVAEAYGLKAGDISTVLTGVRERRSVESPILRALIGDLVLSTSLRDLAARIPIVPAEQALTLLGDEEKQLISTLAERTHTSPLDVLSFAIDNPRLAELVIRSFLTDERINSLRREVGDPNSPGRDFLQAMQQTGANVAELLSVALGTAGVPRVDSWNAELTRLIATETLGKLPDSEGWFTGCLAELSRESGDGRRLLVARLGTLKTAVDISIESKKLRLPEDLRQAAILKALNFADEQVDAFDPTRTGNPDSVGSRIANALAANDELRDRLYQTASTIPANAEALNTAVLTERSKAVITAVAQLATTASVRISPKDVLKFACPGLDMEALAQRTFGNTLIHIERENEARHAKDRIREVFVASQEFDPLLSRTTLHLRENPDAALASACWAAYGARCERVASELGIEFTDDVRDQLFKDFAERHNLRALPYGPTLPAVASPRNGVSVVFERILRDEHARDALTSLQDLVRIGERENAFNVEIYDAEEMISVENRDLEQVGANLFRILQGTTATVADALKVVTARDNVPANFVNGLREKMALAAIPSFVQGLTEQDSDRLWLVRQGAKVFSSGRTGAVALREAIVQLCSASVQHFGVPPGAFDQMFLQRSAAEFGFRNLNDAFWETLEDDPQTKLIRRLWNDPALLSELRRLGREVEGNAELSQGTRALSQDQKASVDNIAQRAGVERSIVIQLAHSTAQIGNVLAISFRGQAEPADLGEPLPVCNPIDQLDTSVEKKPALPATSPEREDFDARFARWMDNAPERYGPPGTIKSENARAFELIKDLDEKLEGEVTGFYRFEDIKPHNNQTVRIVGRITRSTGPLGQLLDRLPQRVRNRLRKVVKDRVNVKDVHYVVVSVEDGVRTARLKAIRAEVLLSSAYRAEDFRPVTSGEEIQLLPTRSTTLGNGTSIVRTPPIIGAEEHADSPEFSDTAAITDELLGRHVMDALVLGRPTHMPRLMTIFTQRSARLPNQTIKATRKRQKIAIVQCLDAYLRNNPVAGVAHDLAEPELLKALADEFILRFEATERAKSVKNRDVGDETYNEVGLHELNSTVRNNVMTSEGSSSRARALYAALERQQTNEFLARILAHLNVVPSQGRPRVSAEALGKQGENALITLSGKTVFGEVVLDVAGNALVVPAADFLKQCHYTGVRLEEFRANEGIELKRNKKSGEYFLYTGRLDLGMKPSNHTYSFKQRAAELLADLPPYTGKASVIGAGVSRYSQWVDRDRYKDDNLTAVGRKLIKDTWYLVVDDGKGGHKAFHPRYFLEGAFPEISGNVPGARIAAGPVSFVPNFRKSKNEQLESGLPSTTMVWRNDGARLNILTNGPSWEHTLAETQRIIPNVPNVGPDNGVHDALRAAFRDGEAHNVLAAFQLYCRRFGDGNARRHPARLIVYVSHDLAQRGFLKQEASRFAKALVFTGRGLEAAVQTGGVGTDQGVDVATNGFSRQRLYIFKNTAGRYFKQSLKALQRLEVAWRAREALSQLTWVEPPADQREVCGHSALPARQATVRGRYNNALVLESGGRQYVVPVAEIIGMHVFANLPVPILQDNATVTFEKMKWKQSFAKETHSMPVKWERARPIHVIAR